VSEIGTSEAVTRGVRVRVECRFVPERSRPLQGYWFFAYTIQIANEGPETVQLISRHWIITDSRGKLQEVRGPGVVGQQPRLEPGTSFEYTSFCPLETSFGTMHGTYRMETDAGEPFDAEIAPFALGEPHSIN
jgi:ApaG protein